MMKTFALSIEEAMEARFGAFFFLVIAPMWLASIAYIWVS